MRTRRGAGAARPRRTLDVLALSLLACVRCAPPVAVPAGADREVATSGDPRRAAGRPGRVAVAPDAGPSGGAAAVASPSVRPLGGDDELALPFRIEADPRGRAVFLVAEQADWPAAFVRRLDVASHHLGPVHVLAAEHVARVLDGNDGRTVLVTSDGERLCVSQIAPDATAPASRACDTTRPALVVPLGERIALLEATLERPPAPKKAVDAQRSARPPQASKPASGAKATGRGKKAPERKGRGGRDAQSADKRKRPARVEPSAPPRPPPTVSVAARFVAYDGTFGTDAVPTGLRFVAPMEGMTLVAAEPRAGGADLLWYESASRRSRNGQEQARLVAGSLREDGTLDPASPAVVATAALGFGFVQGHTSPRLFATGAGAVVLTRPARGAAFSAVRVRPSLSAVPAPHRAVCAADPQRLAFADPPAPGEIAALESILGAGPRRVPLQAKSDAGLVAWAGASGYFVDASGALRSVGRDGAARDVPPSPFSARRARLSWSAFASDGEGIALARGRVHRVDPSGASSSRRAASRAAARTPPPSSRAARASAARIGSSWWAAVDGDLVRLWPDDLEPEALRGVAPPDASALVGGARDGLLLGLASGELRVSRLREDGATAHVSRARSPVRVGFGAAARAGGGALVAGVSASDATAVVAFAVDADGRVSPANPTSLRLPPGELGVRIAALPAGGAAVYDEGRTRVAWIDDDARELASARWPGRPAAGFCVEGASLSDRVPSPEPGRFETAQELAAPGTCVVGDASWARDGSLRWFGARTRGVDAVGEAAVLPLRAPWTADPAPASAQAALLARDAEPFAADPGPSAVAAKPPCPGDMVSVAGRFCIDRFEASLVDAATGEPLSPDYAPTPGMLEATLAEWVTGRWFVGDAHARALPLPELAPSRAGEKPAVKAVPLRGARPNGYLSGGVAESACAAASKRLCTVDELVVACRGDGDTQFPYGDTYEDGACNVFRAAHPAAILHDNASAGHTDPRLDRVRAGGKPLLRETGGTPRCRSRWGSDAAYDLVGNLDEWVAEPSGFAGGFYSRSTRAGCEALITSHPKPYLDYSTGVRCCREAAGP